MSLGESFTARWPGGTQPVRISGPDGTVAATVSPPDNWNGAPGSLLRAGWRGKPGSEWQREADGSWTRPVLADS